VFTNEVELKKMRTQLKKWKPHTTHKNYLVFGRYFLSKIYLKEVIKNLDIKDKIRESLISWMLWKSI
jgi:hypothetical protein